MASGSSGTISVTWAAQQLDPDLLPGVVALHPGGHDEQAVRADE